MGRENKIGMLRKFAAWLRKILTSLAFMFVYELLYEVTVLKVCVSSSFLESQSGEFRDNLMKNQNPSGTASNIVRQRFSAKVRVVRRFGGRIAEDETYYLPVGGYKVINFEALELLKRNVPIVTKADSYKARMLLDRQTNLGRKYTDLGVDVFSETVDHFRTKLSLEYIKDTGPMYVVIKKQHRIKNVEPKLGDGKFIPIRSDPRLGALFETVLSGQERKH
jgi:hypothetical protein